MKKLAIIRKAFEPITADADRDIDLINQYAIKELSPEDVFCFNVVLCDNEIDRDIERFTDKSLEVLAGLFVGKTGITDHDKSADNQIARIYRTEVIEREERNSLGEPLKQLVASVYMLAKNGKVPYIEAGIIKEVSVGAIAKKRRCSICGEPLIFDLYTCKAMCKNGHVKGDTYNGALCFGELEDIVDAYEFSFVTVPAQRGAGVIKNAVDLGTAFEMLKTTSLDGYEKEISELIPVLQMNLKQQEERKARREISERNKKYLEE